MVAADPYSMAALAGFQLISGLQQADLTRQQADLQKQVSDLNAQYAENDAFEQLASGLTEEARYGNVIKNVVEQQKSNFEAAGVDSSYGSAADVTAETKVQGIVNGATIKNNAYAAAMGLKRDALNIRLQGQFNQAAMKQKASVQQSSAIIGAISPALKAYTGGGEKPTAGKDAGGATAFAGGYDLPDVSAFADLA